PVLGGKLLIRLRLKINVLMLNPYIINFQNVCRWFGFQVTHYALYRQPKYPLAQIKTQRVMVALLSAKR
ncbi:hypothetical protein, partial [Shewanella glacialipiscicola]|uniref:hypothetical protein n=1 Tax=Shewanella glacialipiscicola TaxID=614069 RepID=UPI001C7F427B